MRGLLALLVVFSLGCWDRDEFRSKCILQGHCQLLDFDAGVDAGLNPGRWGEAAAVLFDVPDDAGSAFDVSLLSNLSGVSSDRCNFAGGVLTKEGSLVCIPFDADRGLELTSDAGTLLTISLNGRLSGESWAGGVLLGDGTVVGLPSGAATLLSLKLRPPLVGRQPDYVPLGFATRTPLPDGGFTGGARLTAGAETVDGTLVLASGATVTFLRSDGGFEQRSAGAMGEFSAALLSDSARSVTLVPRSFMGLVEATPRTNQSPMDRLTPRGGFTGYSGGLLLENGDALLLPGIAGAPFLRVPGDGGVPMSTGFSRAALTGGTWSTNGFAYALDADGGSGEVAVISRKGDVSWARIPQTFFGDGGVGPLSHLGLTALADGRLVSCGCQSSRLLVLTPRFRRTVPLEVMTKPWVNK